jgi:uncharacterized phage protein (TIGR01671 family)
MRQIKFRMWDSYSEQMNYTPSHEPGDLQITLINDFFKEEIKDGNIIMQYTGLKDSKGKKIYEGDILGCESNGVNRHELRVVCYDSNQAKYKSVPLSTYHSNAGNGGWTAYDLYRTYCEVIGNIFENPGLITH